MKNKYTKTRTCVYNINYHIVWCVKYRKEILTDEVAKCLIDELNTIANTKGFIIHECAVGDNNHIHVFVSAPPKLSPSYIVKMLKGISGRHLFMRYPHIATKIRR